MLSKQFPIAMIHYATSGWVADLYTHRPIKGAPDRTVGAVTLEGLRDRLHAEGYLALEYTLGVYTAAVYDPIEGGERPMSVFEAETGC